MTLIRCLSQQLLLQRYTVIRCVSPIVRIKTATRSVFWGVSPFLLSFPSFPVSFPSIFPNLSRVSNPAKGWGVLSAELPRAGRTTFAANW